MLVKGATGLNVLITLSMQAMQYSMQTIFFWKPPQLIIEGKIINDQVDKYRNHG